MNPRTDDFYVFDHTPDYTEKPASATPAFEISQYSVLSISEETRLEEERNICDKKKSDNHDCEQREHLLCG